MLRAIDRIAAGHDDPRQLRDTLLLDHDERKFPVGLKQGLRGTHIELALPRGTALRQDDRLVLEDGSLVEVVARPEPLIEARAGDPAVLARAAWAVGNMHMPVELTERRLRVRRSESAADLLRPLGLRLIEIEAPFEPEGGAYHHAHS